MMMNHIIIIIIVIVSTSLARTPMSHHANDLPCSLCTVLRLRPGHCIPRYLASGMHAHMHFSCHLLGAKGDSVGALALGRLRRQADRVDRVG